MRRGVKNKRMLRWLLPVCLALGMVLFSGTAAGNDSGELTPPVPEGFHPFIRIDRDSTKAWKKDLANVRLITEGRYRLGETGPESGTGPADLPDTSGMDTLNISGSAQFSTDQFLSLADTLRECAGDREVYIIDLRRESHAMLNGISFSWYEAGNWSNRGLTAEEIEKDQDTRFGSLSGQTITAYKLKKGMPKDDGFTVRVESVTTERELVEDAGFHYLRIPVSDYSWPEPEQVDDFIRFVRDLDMDSVWLHFHCQAGKGRTGEFMVMYDKMKNPDVPLSDIAARQTLLGGSNPLYTDSGTGFRSMLYREKAAMTRLFFDYVDENRASNYGTLWSEWLENREETAWKEAA